MARTETNTDHFVDLFPSTEIGLFLWNVVEAKMIPKKCVGFFALKFFLPLTYLQTRNIYIELHGELPS